MLRVPLARAAVALLAALFLAPAEPASSQPPHNESYDLVVYEATPAGVACAVRAGREGLSVLLVHHNQHVGGMLSNGLTTMDTLYNGERAPLYDELRAAIYGHYANAYGKDSPQFRATNPTSSKTRYEAHIAERLILAMLKREPRIGLVMGYAPYRAEVRGNRMLSATFREPLGEKTFTAAGAAFADCSYEGDLLAVAGLPYRVGREARSEYGEPHAGVIFTRQEPWDRKSPYPGMTPLQFRVNNALNLSTYGTRIQVTGTPDGGQADPAVQAYNMRMVLTRDPKNRILPARPDGYDLGRIRELAGGGNGKVSGLTAPNGKAGWNQPELVGEQTAYIEAGWPRRMAIIKKHVDATLGVLYYYQNEPEVPGDLREQWRQWGLSRDEFTDNGHVPWEVYVREARRLAGAYTFTEHDASLAPGLERAPVHGDSISATEWFMDSHACTPRKIEGSHYEGEVMLKNLTFPGQIPYRTLYSKKIGNLLAPGCLSASHIGWGTIRLEPTWMSIGEAAAHAVVLARQRGSAPAGIDPDALVRRLARAGVMLTFFNDIEGKKGKPWYAALQYLGTKGFFAGYDARPDDPLSEAVAEVWLKGARESGGPADPGPMARAKAVLEAESRGGKAIGKAGFLSRLGGPAGGSSAGPVLTRGEACRLIFERLRE